MLNLTHLRSFIAVVEEGGFREAGRRLDCPQPTISQHVKRLEADLGVPLVHRSHAACTTTPQGARLLPHARSLLRVAERATAAVAGPTLAVGASSNIGTYILPPRLKAFTDRHADTAVSLALGSNPETLARLERGEIDVALTEWWDDRPGYAAVRWRREPLVVIVPPAHPWAGRKQITRARLLATPMIGGEPGSGTATALRRAFGPDADALEVSMTLGSTEAVKQAVRAGLGVSLVLASAVAEEARTGQLRALPVADAALAKDLTLVLPEPAPAESPAAAFAEFLQEAA